MNENIVVNCILFYVFPLLFQILNLNSHARYSMWKLRYNLLIQHEYSYISTHVYYIWITVAYIS